MDVCKICLNCMNPRNYFHRKFFSSLVFEFAFYDVTVENISHYAMKTSHQDKGKDAKILVDSIMKFIKLMLFKLWFGLLCFMAY